VSLISVLHCGQTTVGSAMDCSSKVSAGCIGTVFGVGKHTKQIDSLCQAKVIFSDRWTFRGFPV
ncbi:MAG TPA: hypothetical protein VE616_24075, partial [Candidatus Udaeobacter sp.]|nr:hypothetical protein [Candidatus Udaeobacter sp.]